MCRFILLKSKTKFDPKHFLSPFSQMCQKSRTPNGDRQKDGWGVAWRDKGKWHLQKSLNPIWEEKNFPQITDTNFLIAHARSAGFSDQKGIIEYNQPYIDGSLCFVFNGMLKGVRLDRRVTGKIGAQKIFSLIREEKKDKSLDETLASIDKLLLQNSQKIIGMNIGLASNDRFYALCEFENNSEYFSLKYFRNSFLKIICSESIGPFNWKEMKKGEVLVL